MDQNKINRRQFFESSGNLLLTGLGVSVFASLLASCGKDKNPTGPGSDNGTSEKSFTVNLSENPALQQVGGYKTFRLGGTPVILFRISETTFKTLSLVCTHQGCTIDWQAPNNKFDCACHGSQFDKDGKVLRGPAARSLDSFRTEFKSETNQVIIYY